MLSGAPQGGKALLIGCLPLLLLSGCLGSVMLLSGDGMSSCSPTSTAAVDEDSLPEGPIGQASWSGEQLVNAALVMNAATEMELSVRDQTIGVMTAMGESSLQVIDEGDDAGPDSRGLFQQRDNGAWGSYEDRMDPTTSAEMFFEELRKLDGRDDMEPTMAAHEVQANADAYHYEPYWADAQKVVEALAGAGDEVVPVDAQECDDPLNPGGDPQLSDDCAPVAENIHTSACRAYAAVTAEFGEFWSPLGGVGCYDPRNGIGDHPTGQACDYMMAELGQYPSDRMHEDAVTVVEWMMAHHEVLDVKYIIYDEHIWNPSEEPPGKWDEVKRSEPSYDVDRVGVTEAHIDHIHLSTGPWYNSNGR